MADPQKRTTLGNNEVYGIGFSVGESLNEADSDLDFGEIDYELQQLREQMGHAPAVGKMLTSDEFLEGVQTGYHFKTIIEEAQKDK